MTCPLPAIALNRDVETSVQPAGQQPPEQGWHCNGRFVIEGQSATIWRNFDASGAINPYIIQSYSSSWQSYNRATWSIDPRPDGPPDGKFIAGETGRTEAEVLRDGPDYVSINYSWHTEVVGPVYAYFWGDGTYVGAQRLFSARDVRRYTHKDGKMGGLSGGLSQGPILRALYKTRTWTYAVTDANGKVLTGGAFRPPDLARSIDEYRRMRAQIESLETRFRTDFQDKEENGVSCRAHKAPRDDI